MVTLTILYMLNYDSLDDSKWFTELLGLRKGRQDLLKEVSGDVLEVGCGTGINLQFYPLSSISTLTLLDSSPGMLSVASSKALSLPPPLPTIKTVVADVLVPSSFPPSQKYDYIVSTFTLCVLPSPTLALTNLSDLLSTSGRLLLFENSRSSSGLISAYQDITAEAASGFGGKGCVYNQDVRKIAQDAGLEVVEERTYAKGLFRAYVCKIP
ncbi:hypothetical protein TrCOL_g7613 [Triparma columacea]|uniref:S-adenosyl-L-methionine-dependent methyltransferase n=1 Tax=Triparma columacea TaxID=722753 RepID=A0A9W7LFY4_9STRA|nr:hypothetical protein TrCOL_g7613 [Triparma columacea]